MEYHLKATDEAAMTEALLGAGVLVQSGDVLHVAMGYSLDVIGVIYTPTGKTITCNGAVMPETAPIDGCHANLLGELTDDQMAMLPLIEAPSKPVRVWAS
jgi:hypothetical protein